MNMETKPPHHLNHHNHPRLEIIKFAGGSAMNCMLSRPPMHLEKYLRRPIKIHKHTHCSAFLHGGFYLFIWRQVDTTPLSRAGLKLRRV